MAAIDYTGCELRLKNHEGSEYTDGVHPYDPGGPTRWGITLTDARLYWKPNATATDIRNMPWEIAAGIYRPKYWNRLRGDDLEPGVDDCVFDYGVHSGFGRSGKVLRRVLGLPDTDWHVTDEVIAALNKRDPNAVIDAICGERMQFLRGLSIWPTYKNGFTTRVHEVQGYAHQLANAPTTTPPPMPAVTKISSTQMAKGIHNPPVIAKKVAIGTGVAATAGSSGLAHWVGAHPVETGVIAVAGMSIIGIALAELEARYQAKQEAPTLGLTAVLPH